MFHIPIFTTIGDTERQIYKRKVLQKKCTCFTKLNWNLLARCLSNKFSRHFLNISCSTAGLEEGSTKWLLLLERVGVCAGGLIP